MPKPPDAYVLVVAAGTDAALVDTAEALTDLLVPPHGDLRPVRAVHRIVGAFDLLLELHGDPEQIATAVVTLQADDRVAQTLTLPRVP